MATKREQKQKTSAPQAPAARKAATRSGRPRTAPKASAPSAAKPAAKPVAKPAAKRAARPAPVAARASGTRKPAQPRAKKAVVPAVAVAGPRLTEEEKIEDAKYQPRDLPKRLFQEDRFLFPESYGVTRIRLLVKDPEWVFVHWDIDAKTWGALRAEIGERSMALTRLTLRIVDAEHGGGKTILLPPGSRSWYVRTDASGPRSYRAELGLTLPSGDFRALAESNTVVPPRVGPSPERAQQKGRVAARAAAPRAGVAAAAVQAAPVARAEAAVAPWRPLLEHTDAGAALGAPAAEHEGSRPRGEGHGGASDVHRR